MIEEGRALFLQIAEQIEDAILDGSLSEETQAPSTNELAAFYRINPATAAKGIALLTDKGVLYKRRGVGMFVANGARQKLRDAERARFLKQEWPEIRERMARLGLDPVDLLKAERV